MQPHIQAGLGSNSNVCAVYKTRPVQETPLDDAQLCLRARRHQSFQSLRVNLARQAKKLEEMKGVAVPAAKLKSKQRKETRLENSMKNDSAREFATLKLKQALAVRVDGRSACSSCSWLSCSSRSEAVCMVAALSLALCQMLSQGNCMRLATVTDFAVCARQTAFIIFAAYRVISTKCALSLHHDLSAPALACSDSTLIGAGPRAFLQQHSTHASTDH